MKQTDYFSSDYFPLWNPQRLTWQRMNSLDPKVRVKALRNSSTGFIHRKDVREAILKKCNYQCVRCQSKENLEIDHIIAVAIAAHHTFLLKVVNTKDNLQILCKVCNGAKSPEEGKWDVLQNRV